MFFFFTLFFFLFLFSRFSHWLLPFFASKKRTMAHKDQNKYVTWYRSVWLVNVLEVIFIDQTSVDFRYFSLLRKQNANARVYILINLLTIFFVWIFIFEGLSPNFDSYNNLSELLKLTLFPLKSSENFSGDFKRKRS